MNSIRAATVFVSLALASAALSQSPVGTWKGHITIDDSKMTLTDPNQVKLAKQQIEAARKILITLVFKADKTFTGNPPPTTGKWSMQGNKVTLTQPGKQGSQVFELSKDGKTLTNSAPPHLGIVRKIVLKKS